MSSKATISLAVTLEGAIDCLFGRPRWACPYSPEAPQGRADWLRGWDEAALQDDVRGDRERAYWSPHPVHPAQTTLFGDRHEQLRLFDVCHCGEYIEPGGTCRRAGTHGHLTKRGDALR